MKITIEYDDKTKREYHPTNNIITALANGERIYIETMHPNFNELFTITRTKKTRKSKASEGYSDEFMEAWKPYPVRAGGNSKADAYNAWKARLFAGSPDEAQIMISGVNRYAAFCEVTEKINTEYVMQAARFFGPSKQYLEPWALPVKKVIVLKLPFVNEDLENFAKRNDLPGPNRTETYTEYRRRLQGLIDKRAK